MTSDIVFARWYIRGPADSHRFDRKVPILAEYAGQAFCQTCLIVHKAPVGNEWHIESPDVDRMLCGMVISLEEGEGRRGLPKNVCQQCAELAKEDR
jgi:hypothetical protein